MPDVYKRQLVHRLGEAFIPALGGCAIGGRPIDFHLEKMCIRDRILADHRVAGQQTQIGVQSRGLRVVVTGAYVAVAA